jgi:transcriptional regulator with XRE-family HTH domain
MSSKSKEFGQFFRNRRQALDLTLSEFCRRNGFDKGNVSRLERGLKKPPKSPDLLQTYADALQLVTDSEDRKSFLRLAAIGRGKLPSAVSAERTGDVEDIFRKLGRRLHDSWVKARHLEQWSSTRRAQGGLPDLIRQLIYASTDQPTRIEMPSGEGVQRRGWDGLVEAQRSFLFVPEGVSGWEISVEHNPKRKAESDFSNRKKGPLGLPASEVTFVFVTSRKWDRKQEWRDEKRELGKWKSVEVYDSIDLEAWLESAPGVDAWIASQLGLRPEGVISISDYWESLSRLSAPRFEPDVFLTSRKETATKLRDFLCGPAGVMPFECRSPVEALDFAAAYLAWPAPADDEAALPEDERIRIRSRTVVLKDRLQWDGLAQSAEPLNLFPLPSLSLSPEELNSAVGRGHRVVVFATEYANHRLHPVRLPRPLRHDLEETLKASGFDDEAASKAARAAGGSLSVLKRDRSLVPAVELPKWCSDSDRSAFLPMLLVGAWDDANDVDRDILAGLSGRPYGEVQDAANRLTLVADAPLTRIESRWRLVSPEDAWSLVGKHVTDELLSSFEAIAINVLSQQDDSLTMSADERLKASIRGKASKQASNLIQRGISETTAILGSGFGPVATLPAARDRAIRIVRSTLNGASWLRWATLGRNLALLAEAAPDEFLSAISADLKKKRPELTKVLADDGDHPFMSGCRHSGLLWAFECLAWSSDHLPKVCRVLAKLDEIDSGEKWSNRPAGSLREILLTWYPQTTAGVDKRIAVLRTMAERTPSVAWKVLFAMLPEWHSTSIPTHHPVWQNWLAGWEAGASGEDYWKQVEAAAELITQLVGSDPLRWNKVLEDLQWIPDPYRKQLIDRLKHFPVEELEQDERRQLAEHVRKTVQSHRDFADADWSLPEETISELEAALPVLRPEGLQERYAWLFAPWIDLEGYREEYEAMQAEVDRLRRDALVEIIEEEGLGGVLGLAELAESPGEVGGTLAHCGDRFDIDILPRLLRSSDENQRVLATRYAGIRIQKSGWDWVRTLPLNKWDSKDAGLFLAQARLLPETLEFAATTSGSVSEEFWKSVPAHSGSSLSSEELEFTCKKLIEAGRPESTLLVLICVTFDQISVSTTVVMDVLHAVLDWQSDSADRKLRGDSPHRIQRLFGWLQERIPFNDDEPAQRLAQLEWRYLSLLDGFGALPVTLIHCLSDEPEFFARLIGLVFRSKREMKSEDEPTEEQQQDASHAYRLLMNWKRVPGLREDGSIDGEILMQWLEQARSLCRDSGHLEVADSQIGQMLANWSRLQDETLPWPCEEICDAIEEVESEDLDRGFQIGIHNSRGVVTRSAMDGGDLERRQAAKYRRWADQCDIDWPRTADSLRSVADEYLFDAQREDARATERDQERY